ncbi:retrotransposon ORF1 [Tanacetum coccineum]
MTVRQAHTPATVDTESEPEEAPSEIEEFLSLVFRAPFTIEEFEALEPSDTKTTSSHSSASLDSTAPLSPDHPLTQTLPTPAPTGVLFHRRTARMTVHAQPAMPLGLSARVIEAMTLSDSAFRKRYRSSYETPSPSPSPTLLARKRYRGTSELILDTKTEDNVSGAEGAGSWGEESEDESSDPWDDEEVVPEGQQQAVPVMDTAADEPLGLGYGALRRRELALGEGSVPSTFEIGQSSRSVLEQQRVEETSAPRIPTLASPKWSSGSLPVSPSSLLVPTPVASLVTALVANIAVDEDEYLEVGAQLELHGGILHDYTQHLYSLPPALFRSLQREQERITMTFGASWRPVLALEAWAGHVDARRAELWQAKYDDHRVMDPNSSLGKICLGENVVEISSDKIEGLGDWDCLEYQDTANSGGKKETKTMVFHKMDTEEVSDRFMAPLKLCLEHEVKRGNKVVKKELIVALRGEIYFVKFIINLEEDDVEPEVIFKRSFLRMTKAITDFRAGTITIYPNLDPFLEDTEEEEKSMDDWDQLLDFNINDIPLLGGEELPLFVCKMGKSSHNKKRAMENLNLFYQDIGTSSSTGRHLTQEEAAKEELAKRISQKFTLLERVRHVLETMAYHDKYKKVLNEIWKDKVELVGMIVKEEEEAIKKVKGEALKEKDNPRAFIFPIKLEGQVNENALADTGSDINTMPYRIYEQLGREEMKKVDRGITMINHTQAEAIRMLTNVLCQVGVTTLIAKFLILDIPIDRDAPIVVGRGFLHTINGITTGGNDDEAGSLRAKRSRQFETVEEVFLLQVHHEFFLLGGCNRDAKMGCDGEIDDMLRIKLREAESNEEIFIFVAWIRAFNINEPIYPELCHEFYLTYELDEVCADDELQTKKIIKFRLGGRAHNLTLLEFAYRLGLYHANELEEDRFDMYFQGGLRSDEHLNALEYWLSISRELLDMTRWMKRKRAGTQRESQICCGKFITKIARKTRALTDDVIRSLSTPIYYRELDTTTLRELIDFEGRLILEDPQPGVPRVSIPRPPRASMQDLYDRMGRMEIR